MCMEKTHVKRTTSYKRKCGKKIGIIGGAKYRVIRPSYLLPVMLHNFISLDNNSNIIRCLHGKTHLLTETPS